MPKHIYKDSSLEQAHKAAVRMHKRVSAAQIPAVLNHYKAEMLSNLYEASRHCEAADNRKGYHREAHIQRASALMECVNNTVNSIPDLRAAIKPSKEQ